MENPSAQGWGQRLAADRTWRQAVLFALQGSHVEQGCRGLTQAINHLYFPHSPNRVANPSNSIIVSPKQWNA
jgi:hypothetical protein